MNSTEQTKKTIKKITLGIFLGTFFFLLIKLVCKGILSIMKRNTYRNYRKLGDDRYRRRYNNIIKLQKSLKKSFVILLQKILGFCVLPCVLLVWIRHSSVIDSGENKWFDKTIVQNQYASQNSIETLFVKKDEKNWELVRIEQDLHYNEIYSGQYITADMLKYYEKQLPDFFVKGVKKRTDKRIELSEDFLEDFNKMTGTPATSAEEYFKEYEMWNELYNENHDSKSLYQAGRAMQDVFMSGTSMESIGLMTYAAISISCFERLVEYEERHNGEREVLAEEIGFYNMKSYYFLAKEMKNKNEGKKYRNSFLCLAYGIAKQCLENIDETSSYYAILHYYQGNIGEIMLNEIESTDEELYDQIRKESIVNYIKAKELIDDNPNYYKVEKTMENNIEKGIETLGGSN